MYIDETGLAKISDILKAYIDSKAGENWVNLQGGIPNYKSEIEDNIFVEEEENATDEINE